MVAACAEVGRPGLALIRAAIRYDDGYRPHQRSWHFASCHLRFCYLVRANLVDASRRGYRPIAWPGEPLPADLLEKVPSFSAFHNESTNPWGNRDA